MSEIVEAWEEAIKYYNHDQMSHRDGESDVDRAGNKRFGKNITDKMTETENVVFPNVNMMVPALYARNPRAEFTTTKTDDTDKEFATVVERVVNTLAHRKTQPGLNMKSKAKRAVVMALLCNRAWMEVGWNFKEDSSDGVPAELEAIGS